MRFLLPFAAGACLVVAILLPGEKPGAVAGRLDYWQFLIACACALLFGITLLLSTCKVAARRMVALRAGLVLAPGLLILVACELVCYLRPPVLLMDNPWYLTTREGVEADPELPFRRSAHLRWEGRSRGDLALFNHDRDPFARDVVFATDFEGFRNSRDIRKADLVFLGDSFTEAGNVFEKETFAYLAAERSRLVGRNLGRAGYAPPTELVILKRHALSLNPTAVVWQVSESNDLVESRHYRDWIAAGRPLLLKNTRREQLTRLESWQLRSPTFRFVRTLQAPRPWRQGFEGTFQDAAGSRLPMRMLYRPLPGLPADLRPGFHEMATALMEGQQLLTQNGIALLVVLMPMKFRVMAPALQFDRATQQRLQEAGLEPPSWDVPPNQTLAFHLARLCADADVPFIDLTPELRRHAASGVPVFLPYDSHLSPEGHAVTAEVIVQKLAEVGERGR